MENKPKRSKALIITIIIIIILLVLGYLAVRNRDMFGAKTSAKIARIFAPLLPSDNTKGTNQTDENSKKVVAQAGEDIKKGDSVSMFGTDANNNPIVVKANGNENIYGFAYQDINNGEMGEILLNGGGSNGFWNTFSNFLNNLFNNGNNTAETPPGGGWIFNSSTGLWEYDPNATGGWIYNNNTNTWTPPNGGYLQQCSDTQDNDTDELIDEEDPNCHVDGDLTKAYVPTHYSESSNPGGGGNGGFNPQCSDTKDNDSDELTDEEDPNCHVDGDLTKAYVPTHYSESSNPGGGGGNITPQCSDTIDNDGDELIDNLDPGCHYENNVYDPTDNSEYDNQPQDFTNSDLTAGSVTPTSTTINTPTALYATIMNDGEGPTGYNFSSFFAITKVAEEEGQTNTNGNEGTVSKSVFKKTIAKIVKKIPWISRATALNENIEISVVTPSLQAKASSTVSVNYSFNSAGIYYARACADKRSSSDLGTIIETNEENNCGPWTTFIVTNSLPTGGDLPECSDTIDNDNDTLIDNLDPNCHNSNNVYMPSYDDESGLQATSYECSDTIDNDNDGKIDVMDPNCHIGGDMTKEYIATHDDESSSPEGEDITGEKNKCELIEQNPLEFTDAEKARLAVLLRKFYLISSTLRTADDITTIYNEIDQQKNFMAQVDGLTKQCYLDTNDQSEFLDFCTRNKSACSSNPSTEFSLNNNDNYYDSYYGTRASTSHGTILDIRQGNPWFSKSTNGIFPYANPAKIQGYLDYNYLEGETEAEKCKVVTGYYYGTGTDANGSFNCGERYNNTENISVWGDCYNMSTKITGNNNSAPNENILKQGCKWKDGVLLDDAERILNIW